MHIWTGYSILLKTQNIFVSGICFARTHEFNFGVKLIKKERECAICILVKGIQDRGRIVKE